MKVCSYRYHDDVQCANDATHDGRCGPHSGDRLAEIQALCHHALRVLESDGEYHAEDLADQVLAVIAGATQAVTRSAAQSPNL